MKVPAEFIILEERLRNRSHGAAPCIVALAGGSCSGKSSLGRYLYEKFGDSLAVLSQDDFQLGEDFSKKDTSPYRWDDPENYAPGEVAEVLHSLRMGNTTKIPHYTLGANKRVGNRAFSPKEIIVFEGLYALFPQFRPYVDHSVYVETPFYGRFLRRLFRFEAEVNAARTDIPLRHLVQNVYPAHRKFVVPQRAAAQLIIHNQYSFIEETVPQFDLPSRKKAIPRGEKILSVELPDKVTLDAYRQPGEASLVAITWETRTMLTAEAAETLVGELSTIDWYSY